MKGTVTTRTNQDKKLALDCCHRCGGLMVSELCADTGTVEWHCVTCGERIDQVIWLTVNIGKRDKKPNRLLPVQVTLV